MATPQFFYFDLGNVLCTFDNQLACTQMSQVAGLPEARMRDIFGEHDYQNRLECGQVEIAEVTQTFSKAAGKALDVDAMSLAYSDMFDLVEGIVPLVARLALANVTMGVLSNTSAPHWSFVTDGRFSILPGYFSHFALSFEIGAMKPAPQIYKAAEKIAGVPAQSIFFTDDRAENVEAAKAAGWDAIHFESPGKLAEELRRRGVEFNY